MDGVGRLHVASAGASYVIGIGAKLEVLAVNDLGDPNHASPAVYGDKLILIGTYNVHRVGAPGAR